MRLVEIDQSQHADGDADAGKHVDEEQPVPRQHLGQVAADGGANGRRQRRDKADDRRHHEHLAARKNRIGRCEHGGDHAGAEESLDGAPENHLLDRRSHAAHQAGEGEPGRRDREQVAGAKRPRHEARQRDRDHLGDQVRRLHPGDLVRRGRQAGLDFRQRGRDDLDVQDRHEHPEHHDQEREHPLGNEAFGIDRGRRGRRRAAHGRSCCGGAGHDVLSCVLEHDQLIRHPEVAVHSTALEGRRPTT